jgi:hypothetical protein
MVEEYVAPVLEISLYSTDDDTGPSGNGNEFEGDLDLA